MAPKLGSCATSPHHVGWSGPSTSLSTAAPPKKGGEKLTIMHIRTNIH